MITNSELIVILKQGLDLQSFEPTLTLGATLSPLFPNGKQAVGNKFREEMKKYFIASLGEWKMEDLLSNLRAQPWVEAAYLTPAIENPYILVKSLGELLPVTLGSAPSDFTPKQGYLGVAPGGINAASAWKRLGGKGNDVRILDIEGGWVLDHVDLHTNSLGLVDGSMAPGLDWRNHGTAVLGEIGGDEEKGGVTGIAPSAKLGAVSHYGRGGAAAIEAAARFLRPGDVMLLEMHTPGPRYNYELRDDQLGYIAVEWFPHYFIAISYAISLGIIVVEAAGNGAENFDDPLYDQPKAGFPSNWVNPLANRVDSGAILVGAGVPPPYVSPNYGNDRSRFYYSNYGKRVDCQGWGAGIVTTGYGDLFKSVSDITDERYWYTGQFGGTSGASPIVAGVIACLQGIAKSKKPSQLITQAVVREALRRTGSPQQASTVAPLTQNIGKRPDLQTLCKYFRF
jgi:Subtilase family